MDELASVSDELSQLAQGRRGHPALGQPPQAEQVDQVGGVALVVLHPAIAPVVAERVGQMDPASAGLDDIGGPVPTVGGLDDHLGVLAGLGQLGGQGLWVIVDPNGVEGLAGLVAPNDDAAASVQIDADILC